MAWKGIVVAAAAVSGLVGFNGASGATDNPGIVFAGSPNHGTQAAQLFRVRVSGSNLGRLTTDRVRPTTRPSLLTVGASPSRR